MDVICSSIAFQVPVHGRLPGDFGKLLNDNFVNIIEVETFICAFLLKPAVFPLITDLEFFSLPNIGEAKYQWAALCNVATAPLLTVCYWSELKLGSTGLLLPTPEWITLMISVLFWWKSINLKWSTHSGLWVDLKEWEIQIREKKNSMLQRS